MFSSEEIMELLEEVPRAAFNAVTLRQFGLRIISPSVRRHPTVERRAYNRAYTAKAHHEEIRQRILAGERPKTGGRGRPPLRWWRMANELGIDIGQPKETTK